MFNKNQPDFLALQRDIAEAKAPLVFFAGSGLSAPAKLPTWKTLRDMLVKSSIEKISTLESNAAKYLQAKLEVAKHDADFWLSFSLLKEILGPATFYSEIRRILSVDPNCIRPIAYDKISTNSRTKAIVTTNLDQFAVTAMAAAHPNELVATISGMEITSQFYLIQKGDRFVLQLHGHLGDVESWVLTREQLSKLQNNEVHRLFLHTLFAFNIVVFVGISADDQAVSGRLLELKKLGIKPIATFWITDRPDLTTDSWAQENDIRIIRYRSDETHSELLEALDILSKPAKITEAPAAPVVISNASPPDHEITATELQRLSPVEIRNYLSGATKQLFDDAFSSDTFEKYDAFLREYRLPIHMSFFHDEDLQFDWFGYRVSGSAIGHGRFSKVFLATDSQGVSVAVKIMKQDVFNQRYMLGSFRRGVRAARIINKANLPGMVRLIDATEVPPTIFMEFIPGPSLADIIEGRLVRRLPTKLRIMSQVARIIRSAHLLPETVLHRDVKPSNIMVRDFDYTRPEDQEFDIVVFDFDLAWHVGAKEKDPELTTGEDLGYLSPEQLDQKSKFPTRTALVDSFGFGMTLFSIISGQKPVPNQSQFPEWKEVVLRAIKLEKCPDWLSTSSRLARLILRCTDFDQSSRPDFGQIISEIEFLLTANERPEHLDAAEFWAEELMARTGSISYEYVPESNRFIYKSPQGATISIIFDDNRRKLKLTAQLMDPGNITNSIIDRNWKSIFDKAPSILTVAGWKILGVRSPLTRSIAIDAEIQLEDVANKREVVFRSMQSFFAEFRWQKGM